MPGIFISYRREDSAGSAGRLYADLKRRFQREQVFIDVAGISIGQDFRKTIERHVAACEVLLVVIGKEWLTVRNAAGQRRLQDPKDFVRLELIAALTRDVAVVPVLVDGATMPRPEELPAELEALGWRNGMELRHTRWDDDAAELSTALSKLVRRDAPSAVVSASLSPERPPRDEAIGAIPQPTARSASRPTTRKRAGRRWFAMASVLVVVVGAGLWFVGPPWKWNAVRGAKLEIRAFAQKGFQTGRGATNLCWSIQNARSARIDPEVGDLDPSTLEKGCRPIQPTSETTYTLTASGLHGRTEKRRVTVTPKQ